MNHALRLGSALTFFLCACSGDDDTGNRTDLDTVGTNVAPTVSIASPDDDDSFALTDSVTFTILVSDDRDAPSSLNVRVTSDRITEPLFEGHPDTLGSVTFSKPLVAGEHLILVGAVDSAGLAGTATVGITVTPEPGTPSVVISPPNPTGADVLTATVIGGPPEVTYTYRWFKNGQLTEARTANVDPSLTAKGEVWQVRVNATDGSSSSPDGLAEVTILNAAPICAAAVVFPSAADTAKDLRCSCADWQDPDGDSAEDTCTFFDGEVELDSNNCSLPASETEKDMSITCVLTPGDGTLDGVPKTSSAVVILDSHPSTPTALLTPVEADASTTLTCVLGTPSVDLDGDSITYAVAWFVDGHENLGFASSTIVASTLRDGSGAPARRDSSITCALRASDGDGPQSAPGTSNVVVLDNAAPDVEAPTVAVTGSGSASEAAVLVCEGDATDPDDDGLTVTYVWYVNGVEVAGVTSQNLTGQHFARGDAVTCAIVADDGLADPVTSDEAKTTVTIGNSLPSLLGASISPLSTGTNGQLTCTPLGWSDPDGDVLEVRYAWLEKTGANYTPIANQSNATLTPSMLSAGDEVVCEVTPKNGTALGQPVRSEPAAITAPAPTAPVVIVNAPDGAGGVVRCDFVTPASGFAGTISYTFRWTVNGGTETVGAATITGLSDCDLVACRATATDGVTTLSSAPASLLLPVGADCSTGDQCRPATCKPAGGCDFVLADNVPCDDGNACTTGDACELGFCTVGGFANATVTCDDGLFCTGKTGAVDHCNGAGQCVGGSDPCASAAGSCLVGTCNELEDKCLAAPRPVGSGCQDGNGCTANDACSNNGVCLPGAAADCSASADACNDGVCSSLSATAFSCSKNPKAAGVACTSSDFCTVGTQCNGFGVCAGGTERDCEAEVGDECNSATCDSFGAQCIRVAADAGTSCDDDNACTRVDACSNGACIGSGDACVEERLSAVYTATARPSMLSLGFGRYVTQWWNASGPVAFRTSDNRGSRENEEIVPASAGHPPTWSTRMAVRPGGDYAAPSWDGVPTLTVCSCPAGQVGVANGTIHGRAFDVNGTQIADTALINATLRAPSCNFNPSCITVAVPSARMVSLALQGSFSFVLGGEYTRQGNAGGDPNMHLAPFFDRALRLHPSTGLMTVGTPVVLVPADQIANGSVYDARVAADGSATFLVAWVATSTKAINVRPFMADGQPAPGSSSAWQVHTGNEVINDVRIAGRGDGSFVVAWDATGADTSGRGVYVRRFDSVGDPIDPAPVRVNTATTGDQRLGELDRFASDGYVVAFDDQNGDASGYGVKARIYNANGTPRGGVIDVNRNTAGAQYLPTVSVLENDEWAVAFIDDQGHVWTRRYFADGSPSVGRLEWPLNDTKEGSQKHVGAASLGNGQVLAAYESPVLGLEQGEIIARLVEGTSANPVLGPELRVNQTSTGVQLAPVVGAGGGKYVVAWQSVGQDGSAEGVYLRVLDNEGEATGNEVQVAQTAAGYQRTPAIAVDPAGYSLVTWTSQLTGVSVADVFVRAFDAAGAAVGNEQRVNTTVDGAQDSSAVAFGPDGGAVVVWQGPGDGSGLGVWIRKVSSTGVPSGVEVQVNSEVDLDQSRPSVAVAQSGDRLTVCWQSYGQDADTSIGVYCQVMAYSSLAKVGSEVRLNTIVNGEQRSPAVAYFSNGTMAVAWDSENVDSDRSAVQVRKLTGLAQPSGPRIVVNRTWAGTQEVPVVVPLGGTTAMILWEASGQDGSDKGVMLRVVPGL